MAMEDEETPIAGVLVSGGLDSCILLGQLVEKGEVVQPFYIRTGVQWEACEESAVRRFVQALGSPRVRSLVTLEMPLADLYEDHWSLTGNQVPAADSPDEAVFLPGRNALLLVKPAVWCQLHRVPELLLAPLGTSPFEDASSRFIARFEEGINCGAVWPVRIKLPFAGLDKSAVMELGRHLPLQHTFSCIAPVAGEHCGQCNKCAERQQAFAVARIPDVTSYATKPAVRATGPNTTESLIPVTGS